MSTTMVFGFLTELYSRPVITVDETEYKRPVGKLGFVGKVNYVVNSRALHLISEDQWEGDAPLVKKDGTVAPAIDYRYAQYTSNFVRRLTPYYFGWIPFVAVFAVLIMTLEWNKIDAVTAGAGEIPVWVNISIYSVFMVFCSFSFVLPVYQYLTPGMYFGAELTYCALSLGSKVLLGGFYIGNVFFTERMANDNL